MYLTILMIMYHVLDDSYDNHTYEIWLSEPNILGGFQKTSIRPHHFRHVDKTTLETRVVEEVVITEDCLVETQFDIRTYPRGSSHESINESYTYDSWVQYESRTCVFAIDRNTIHIYESHTYDILL